MRFTPVLQPKVWGGKKLQTLNKSIGDTITGESWEVSAMPGFESTIDQGVYQGYKLNELWQQFGKQIGGNLYKNSDFPLLIKFLDAAENLSVQVHPNDQQAEQISVAQGKTEMWYVLQADSQARIYLGFQKEISKEKLQEILQQGNVVEHLRQYKPVAGDCFFVPAGTVHAIGGGVLLAEIQQNSDTTYRLYDWDRNGTAQNPRELHIEQGLQVFNPKSENAAKCSYDTTPNQLNPMVRSAYFATNYLKVQGEFQHQMSQTFCILMCTKSSGIMHYGSESLEFYAGDTFLLPAELKEFSIRATDAELLHISPVG